MGPHPPDSNLSPGLVPAVADRTHFPDATGLVGELTDRGLLADGRLTSAARELTAAVQTTITTQTAPIWDNLPADDVAAATRGAERVVTRARAVLR